MYTRPCCIQIVQLACAWDSLWWSLSKRIDFDFVLLRHLNFCAMKNAPMPLDVHFTCHVMHVIVIHAMHVP